MQVDAPAPAQTFQVVPLVEELDKGICCSSWNASCSMWASGSDDGQVTVWEKTGPPGSLTKMRQVATWQASCSPASRVTHLSWSPPSAATQLAVCCHMESANESTYNTREPGGASEKQRHIRGGEIGIWGPLSPLFQTNKGFQDDDVADGEGRRSSSHWQLRAVLQVPVSVNAEALSHARDILWISFLDCHSDEDTLLLLLAAITAEGKLLAYSSRSTMMVDPKWTLRDEACLVTEAMVHPGRTNLLSANGAVHPSCNTLAASGRFKTREGTTSIAVSVEKARNAKAPDVGPASEAKVWAYSNKFMRWYAVADLLGGFASHPGFVGGVPKAINNIAWCPQLNGLPFDTIALATSSGVALLKLSSPSSGPSVLTAPDPFLKVEMLPVKPQSNSTQAIQVAWHWTGLMLAVAFQDGQVEVLKQGVEEEWAVQCHIAHG